MLVILGRLYLLEAMRGRAFDRMEDDDSSPERVRERGGSLGNSGVFTE
jgi:hypothetical protein